MPRAQQQRANPSAVWSYTSAVVTKGVDPSKPPPVGTPPNPVVLESFYSLSRNVASDRVKEHNRRLKERYDAGGTRLWGNGSPGSSPGSTSPTAVRGTWSVGQISPTNPLAPHDVSHIGKPMLFQPARSKSSKELDKRATKGNKGTSLVLDKVTATGSTAPRSPKMGTNRSSRTPKGSGGASRTTKDPPAAAAGGGAKGKSGKASAGKKAGGAAADDENYVLLSSASLRAEAAAIIQAAADREAGADGVRTATFERRLGAALLSKNKPLAELVREWDKVRGSEALQLCLAMYDEVIAWKRA